MPAQCFGDLNHATVSPHLDGSGCDAENLCHLGGGVELLFHSYLSAIYIVRNILYKLSVQGLIRLYACWIIIFCFFWIILSLAGAESIVLTLCQMHVNILLGVRVISVTLTISKHRLTGRTQ